jgi:hypothetical protein
MLPSFFGCNALHCNTCTFRPLHRSAAAKHFKRTCNEEDVGDAIDYDVTLWDPGSFCISTPVGSSRSSLFCVQVSAFGDTASKGDRRSAGRRTLSQ